LSLNENYQRVKEEIYAATVACGRSPADVHLIAVSKTHPVAQVDALAALGQVDFGENRIAELVEKKNATLAKNIRWHLIGQLQTNKVKLLPQGVILHTLDRVSLADKLAQHFATNPNGESGVDVLIQVNCSGEENKSGVHPDALDALCEYVAQKSAIRVRGLMTMAEHTDEEKTIRKAFAHLRSLSENIAAQKFFLTYENILSMGMSGDFKIAIQEGATHVRIGSAIFGSR